MILRSSLIASSLWLVASAVYDDYDTYQNYGYVGPACAVVGTDLYKHGRRVRELNNAELARFFRYQADLSRFKEQNAHSPLPYQVFLAIAPAVPDFCGGLDDSVEVVLDGCSVRNEHVYSATGRLIRPLNSIERQQIGAVLGRRNAPPPAPRQPFYFPTQFVQQHYRRWRRQTNSSQSDVDEMANSFSRELSALRYRPQAATTADLTSLFHRFFNVNATVASRFLPAIANRLFANELPVATEIERPSQSDQHRERNHRAQRRNAPPMDGSSTPTPLVRVISVGESSTTSSTEIQSSTSATQTTMATTSSPVPTTKPNSALLQILSNALANEIGKAHRFQQMAPTVDDNSAIPIPRQPYPPLNPNPIANHAQRYMIPAKAALHGSSQAPDGKTYLAVPLSELNKYSISSPSPSSVVPPFSTTAPTPFIQIPSTSSLFQTKEPLPNEICTAHISVPYQHQLMAQQPASPFHFTLGI